MSEGEGAGWRGECVRNGVERWGVSAFERGNWGDVSVGVCKEWGRGFFSMGL